MNRNCKGENCAREQQGDDVNTTVNTRERVDGEIGGAGHFGLLITIKSLDSLSKTCKEGRGLHET